MHDLPSGTGPRLSEAEGVTASVRDIISNTDANEPRARVVFRAELTRLVLSSSTSRRFPGEAVCSNVARESCVIGDRERRPGTRVLQLQKLSTMITTSKAAPHRMPPLDPDPTAEEDQPKKERLEGEDGAEAAKKPHVEKASGLG